MSDIFLSYHSSDRATAQLFADALEAHGWSVWWDREIPLGKRFDQVIEEELNAARCAVVLWSQESVRSRWVRTEASSALGRDCLVPIQIEEAAIPLEFKQVQAAMLVGWAGDTSNPEFVRLLQAIAQLLGREPRPVEILTPRRRPAPPPTPWWRRGGGAAVAVVAAVLAIAVVTFTLGRWRQADGPSELHSTGATTDAGRGTENAAASSSPVAGGPEAATDRAPGKGMPIKIGDRIEDGAPGQGAGSIETPYSEDAYSFTATPGQRVYFRVVGYSEGLAYIKWRLADGDGTELFNTCFGCTEPGVVQLKAGGRYTLSVGNDKDPATGTYRLRLFDVPPAAQFSIKIDDPIAEGVPGSGAGAIESPGAEDVYTFTAAPRQRVYFRSLDRSTGMDYLKMALTDDEGNEVFNVCLGCTEPGVQVLTKGGTYRLTVGSRNVPATGTYRMRVTNVPPPNEFSIKVGDRIKPGVPGVGAGSIERPGAEDVYAFTAAAGQQVFFRLLERDKGMDYNKWRLVDDNGMELFNTCLGCSAPGVQKLTSGGRYTLIVGNKTESSTGNYAFDTGSR